MPLHPEVNTAEDLVGAAMRQMAGVLKDRRVETNVDLTEPALAGRFDFVQSLRILSNLLGNAVRYTPPASPIELSVHRDGAALVFVVADRGPGIPMAERDRIFEPFYRPAGAPADGGGAGLGLSIARRLAELRGGRAVPLRLGDGVLGEVIIVPQKSSQRWADQERQAIQETLQQTGGKCAETARRLGISRTTLWRRLKAAVRGTPP